MPGQQRDGRESDAPDICTSCGGGAIELVRRGGGENAPMMPATDTLHQMMLASGGQISGAELLVRTVAPPLVSPCAHVPTDHTRLLQMNMLHFGMPPPGEDPAVAAAADASFQASSLKNRPTDATAIAALERSAPRVVPLSRSCTRE
jgi:hypothetical protein